MFISYLLELTVIFLHVNQCFLLLKKNMITNFKQTEMVFNSKILSLLSTYF